MHAEPQDEHRWLQRLVGEWTYEHRAAMGPEQPEEVFRGTESVRGIGDLWILAEGRGTMPGGGAATMMLTIGFDPERKRFVGTWIGSMMTTLWIYDGWLSEDGATLTLEAEGPSFSGDGTRALYRDITEMKSPDHRVFRGTVRQEDGTWHEFMRADYRRKA